ncbi:hypothetical protein ILUMI_25511 [Ignelater luminosus]|uniref:Uncharacterized protein n=1 Tax=Ignelater luminosus TaxID=2038154 RepID=A0A8K0CAF4_IGNLU|nr:hypothetical protein ILUMI_25511 [Ignelater luminosus]
MSLDVGSVCTVECNQMKLDSNQYARESVRMRFRNLSVFCIHAPTEDKEKAEKEEFYALLEGEVDKTPNNDILMHNLWVAIKRIVENVAEKVIGKQKRWYDEECRRVVTKRNEARMKWMQRRTRARREEYEYLRRIAKNTQKESVNN